MTPPLRKMKKVYKLRSVNLKIFAKINFVAMRTNFKRPLKNRNNRVRSTRIIKNDRIDASEAASNRTGCVQESPQEIERALGATSYPETLESLLS